MVGILKRLLPLKPGQFLDIGVNVGQTLLAVKALDPDRSYIGLEPNPVCVAYVDQLTRLNNLSFTTVIPVGLGSTNGLLTLHLYSSGSADPSASIVSDFRPEQKVAKTLFVPVFDFAELERALQIGKLGVIKIDVEGGEADALSSLQDRLRSDRPWVLAEILPCYGEENVDRIRRQTAIEAMLDNAGYRIFRIAKGADGHLSGLVEISTIGVHGDMDLVDYVFCPRDEEGLLRSTFDVRTGTTR